MPTIKPLPEFIEWVDGLSDAAVRGVVVARIKRLERGLMGDVQPVGNGVSELRIQFGAGWRIYFAPHGRNTIVLLTGGSKRSQKADIERARILAALLD
jgi:putative addiction module killer protein